MIVFRFICKLRGHHQWRPHPAWVSRPLLAPTIHVCSICGKRNADDIDFLRRNFADEPRNRYR